MTIKRTPDDFQVEEMLAPERAAAIRPEKARFALFVLTKHSLSTPEAIAQVSKKLRVAPGRLAFAGLKDKHAATSQHITIREPAERASTLPRRDRGHQWEIERLGWIDDELDASAIAGNRFAILIRGLSREESQLMNQALELLAIERNPRTGLPSRLRIVNYFGDQRFGSARHGQGFLARNLIAGDFEGALKLAIATSGPKDRRELAALRQRIAGQWGGWADLLASLPAGIERPAIAHLVSHPGDFRGAFARLPYFEQQIAVEAYQSHLWNQIAQRLVDESCAEAGEMIEADDPHGNLLFPAAAAVPPHLAGMNLPVLGRRTELQEPWKPIAEQVLIEQGLTISGLHIPGLKKPYFGEAPRRLFIEADDVALGNPQRDDSDPSGSLLQRRLVIHLPRGAYATVVLRALGQ